MDTHVPFAPPNPLQEVTSAGVQRHLVENVGRGPHKMGAPNWAANQQQQAAESDRLFQMFTDLRRVALDQVKTGNRQKPKLCPALSDWRKAKGQETRQKRLPCLPSIYKR